MKRFIRTGYGKTLMFLLCILSAVVLTGSIVGAMIMLGDGMPFYTQTEENIQYQAARQMTSSDGYDCLSAYLNDQSYRGELNCRVIDPDGKTVYTTVGSSAVKEWEYTRYFGVERTEDETSFSIYAFPSSYVPDKTDDYYKLMIHVPDSSYLARRIALTQQFLHIAYSLRYMVYLIAAAALVLMILSFTALMQAAGHRPDTEEIFPGPLCRIPFDVLTGIDLFIGFVGIMILTEVPDDAIQIAGIILLLTAGICVFLGLCMSAAVRIKLHTFLENTVIYKCLKLIWKLLVQLWNGVKRLYSVLLDLLRNLPLIWKTALALCFLSFLEAFVIVVTRHSAESEVILFVLEKAVLIPCILYFVLCLQRLQKGAAALAEGDLSYQTDTKGMFWDLKQHGDHLNSIAEGMTIAVEDRMKSERMKTELITNVSHDIKTPLTSIINYASLIGSEPCENEKITEYAEVLVRQSDKLKRLIEDLVEASKASTGSLDVILAPCDASVFISQAAGEYEEKMNEADLHLITKHPDKKIMIMADGRRMWRIFDNLMNNICKYAQPGTRVYLSLEETDGQAVISFKNTSREELDMPEEELMERFTRGDSSRNTDGNGLGLSIARSMAELQNGSLHLSIDGDLFKAVISFPVIR